MTDLQEEFKAGSIFFAGDELPHTGNHSGIQTVKRVMGK